MRSILLLLSCLILRSAIAQKSSFVSPTDQELTIKKIQFYSLTDNMSGIYSRPLTAGAISHLSKFKQYDFFNTIDEKFNMSPEELEEKSDKVKEIYKQKGVDTILVSHLSKGSLGISIKVELFSTKNGLPIASTEITGYQGFEISEVQAQYNRILDQVFRKIPYHGTVLSRKSQLVTIDIGANQGLKEGQDLNVVQIVKVYRHPKFHFIVGTDKEILGHLKVKKVDENLSFASIVGEREEETVKPGQKIIVEQFVTYNDTPVTADQKLISNLDQSPDKQVAFGDRAREWIPDTQPTFGKVGLMLGFSQYSLSSSLGTSGGLSTSNSFAPLIQLDSELWINSEWFAEIQLRDHIFSVKNPGASTPGTLNISATQYSLNLGYNFLIAEQFWGPKFQVVGGYSDFKARIDQSSPLTSFTSQEYSGLMVGIGGSLPVENEKGLPIAVGARLNYFLSPSLSETPVNSGSASNSMTSFQLYSNYRYTNRLMLKGAIDYSLYSSSFSGTGTRGETASSSSQSIISLMGGIDYLF